MDMQKTNCKKCGGVLIRDFEEVRCLMCGYMEYTIPTNIQEDVKEAQGKNLIERNNKDGNYYYDKEDELFGVER